MYTIHLTALRGVKKIKLELVFNGKVIAAQDVEKGEHMLPALDGILKRSKLVRTNVEDIFVTCESGTSFLSCQMIVAARDMFVFARSVSLPAGRQV